MHITFSYRNNFREVNVKDMNFINSNNILKKRTLYNNHTLLCEINERDRKINI